MLDELRRTVIKSRADRVKFLKDRTEMSVVDAKLEDFLPSPGRRLQEKIKDAQLLLVTSQEIDRLGEEGNVPLARRLMDDLLHQLRRLFSILGDLGFQRIVVAADHGTTAIELSALRESELDPLLKWIEGLTEWWTRRSIAAAVVIGSLKICSHLLNGRFELNRTLPRS